MRAGIVMCCAALAALTGACRDGGDGRAPEPARIEVKATIAPLDERAVLAPVDGTVAEMLVADGSTVKAGQPLVLLSNPAVERDLTYARTSLASLEARIREHDQGARRVEPAGRGEDAALARMQQAERHRDRVRGLLASGDVTRGDLELAEAELAVAKREVEAVQARAAAARGAHPGSARELLGAELARARADLTVAGQRKSQLVIKAPASGVVQFSKIQRGASVFARDAVASIVDPSTIRAEGRIAPELLRFVRIGQPVDVTVMTIPPRSTRVPLTSIVPAGVNGGSRISATIPNADRTLQPGTPATITIP